MGNETVMSAGWYEAPHAGGQQRYWDGAQWLDVTPEEAFAQAQVSAADPAQLAEAGASDSSAGGKRTTNVANSDVVAKSANAPSPVGNGRLGWLSKRSTGLALLVTSSVMLIAAIVLGATTASNYRSAMSLYEENVGLRDDVASARAEAADIEADRERTQRLLNAAQAALEPQQDLDSRAADVTAREADVSAREGAVQGREDAITARETYVQQTTLTGGKYTVGVSMEAGIYRTNNTSSTCYWAVYTSGTNYDDIVQNDLGSVGVLTVTVLPGQDFETTRCGSWTKIG